MLANLVAEKEAKKPPVKAVPPPPEGTPTALTLRLATDDKPYSISLLASGGKTFDCPKATFVVPCVLENVPAGPAKLTVKRDGDSATTTLVAPAGAASRRLRFTPKKQGYKNVLLGGGIAALVLGGVGMAVGIASSPEGETGPNLGFLLPGVGLVFGGAVLTTFGAVGIGGTTVDASVAIQ
mgnify:CR=1 FL=1